MVFYQRDFTGNEPEVRNGPSPVLERNAPHLSGTEHSGREASELGRLSSDSASCTARTKVL